MLNIYGGDYGYVGGKEVEHVLYELESVAEAAVVGVPDERYGMAVKAVVAPRPGTTLTADDVLTLPAASRATASRAWLPLGAVVVFQTTE